jgi:sn-glycerol 3-phosphate transport system permease protein
MVEHRRFGNWLPHLVLIIGVIVVAFPVYMASSPRRTTTP